MLKQTENKSKPNEVKTYIKKIGSTAFEVSVRYSGRGEPLPDKIVRLASKDAA